MMRKHRRALARLLQFLKQKRDQGFLEPEQFREIKNGVRKFEHALKIRDMKQAEAAVDLIANALLKIS